MTSDGIATLMFVILSMSTTVELFATVESISHNDDGNDSGRRRGTAATEHKATSDIVFDQPDLISTISNADGGEILLEAFKSTSNDMIMKSVRAGSQSELFWVSVGHPAFVASASGLSVAGQESTGSRSFSSQNTSMRLFHFTSPSRFYAYIEMLTLEHRRHLAATANTKYRILSTSEQQVSNLVLSQFECSVSLYNSLGGHVRITGCVTDFRSYPLRIDFEVPQEGIEMNLLAQQLGTSSDDLVDLQFMCKMASEAEVMKMNILSIDAKQRINLVDKLFGSVKSATPLETVYVTRHQLAELAAEMYSIFNIVDDFRMSIDQFVEAFSSDLVGEDNGQQLTVLPVDIAVSSLSDYRLDIGGNSQRQRIFGDLLSLFKVEQLDDGNGSRIIADELIYDDLQRLSARGNGAELLGIQMSVEWARNNSASAEVNSIDDQLQELNNASDITWSIDGGQLVPKLMRVIGFDRSDIDRKSTFDKVSSQTSSAAFQRSFSLYTLGAVTSTVEQSDVVDDVDGRTAMPAVQSSIHTETQPASEARMKKTSAVPSATDPNDEALDGGDHALEEINVADRDA